MNTKYQPHDWRSLEYHRVAANKIKADPKLVQLALDNIERWKARNGSTPASEWLEHIQKGTEHLITFMLSESDEAQRLRSSSPFVGDEFLTQEERMEILNRFKQGDFLNS